MEMGDVPKGQQPDHASFKILQDCKSIDRAYMFNMKRYTKCALINTYLLQQKAEDIKGIPKFMGQR